MNNPIQIVIDFNVCDRLVSVFKESTSDQWVGEVGGEKSEEWCREELERIQMTRVYGKRERLGIMKILYMGLVVGFSIPRKIEEDEYLNLGIKEDSEFDWFRVGTIYISKEYRRMGIVGEAIVLFSELYPNLIWVCDERNMNSVKSAFRGGFRLSHRLWHRVKGESSLVSIDECERVSLVFKREEYLR